MDCYYNEDMGAPLFAAFFEDQGEVKKEHAKQFLKQLRKCEGKIHLPVIKRPNIDNWETGTQALEAAPELDNILAQLQQNLKTLASAVEPTPYTSWERKYLNKQKKNTGYLEHQCVRHKELENQALQEDPT